MPREEAFSGSYIGPLPRNQPLVRKVFIMNPTAAQYTTDSRLLEAKKIRYAPGWRTASLCRSLLTAMAGKWMLPTLRDIPTVLTISDPSFVIRNPDLSHTQE